MVDPAGADESSAGSGAPGGRPAAPQVAVTELVLDGGQAFRGDLVHVRGRVAPLVSGVRVSIVLSGEGKLHVPLGDAIVGDDGTFDARIELPRTLPLGRYHVTAHGNTFTTSATVPNQDTPPHPRGSLP